MVDTVTLAPVELAKMRNDISALQVEEAALVQAFQDASGDFSEQLRLGTEITRKRDEIATLEKRYAKATGEAVPSVKAKLAEELKALVMQCIADDLEAINAKVREIWSVQSERKLETIELGFDYEHPTEVPTISLSGGFVNRQKTTNASGGGRSPSAKWLVGDDELGTKGIIQMFGAKYNQSKAWDDMTPAERTAFRDVIIAGENLQKVGAGE